MATLSRGYSFGATESVTNAKLHALVDNGSVGNISDTDVASDAGIDSSKVAFNLTDYVTLAGTQTITGSKTFSGTTTFSGSTNVGMPIGGIAIWSTAVAPTGWLLCDGSAVSRTTYASLFGVIGTTYGVGDTTTTFNVPNLKGRVPVGINASDTEFDALGETGGAKSVTLTSAQSGVPAHNHTQSTADGDGGPGASVFDSGSGSGPYPVSISIGLNTPADAVSAHTNLQPYITLNYIIRHA